MIILFDWNLFVTYSGKLLIHTCMWYCFVFTWQSNAIKSTLYAYTYTLTQWKLIHLCLILEHNTLYIYLYIYLTPYYVWIELVMGT